jgi:hypothetical protein
METRKAHGYIWTSVLYFFTYFSKSAQALVITYDEIIQALAVEGDVLLPKLFPDPPAHTT